jgi:hypothetical protein
MRKLLNQQNRTMLNLINTLLERQGGSLHPFGQVQPKLHQYMASTIELAQPDSACM